MQNHEYLPLEAELLIISFSAGICVLKLRKAYLLILKTCTITMVTSSPLLPLKLVRLSGMR